MTDLLIPFGLDRNTKNIVEPEDAARGRACNCICPGCQAPLLSRHPKENRAHFAHDSKNPEAKPQEKCPFSSAVAIAMMARELTGLLRGKEFKIPDYDCEHHFECCDDIEILSVTKQKRLTISSASKKPSLTGQSFDLELGFGESTIFVDLCYKGKPPQRIGNKKTLGEEKSGVLAINCDTLDVGTLAQNKQLKFSEAVLDFLLETGFRLWRFHPRQLALSAKLEASHQCKPFDESWGDTREYQDDSGMCVKDQSLESLPAIEHKLPEICEPKSYHCVKCKHGWLQKKAGLPICPKCNSHLFSTEYNGDQ